MTLLNETPTSDITVLPRTAEQRPLQPQMAAQLRALRRARRDAEVRAIRVRRILLTR